MTRQVSMVFFGDPHWAEDGKGHDRHAAPHEAPWTMLTPLVVLAGLAMVGGFLNSPLSGRLEVLTHWLEPVVGPFEAHSATSTATKIVLAGFATLAALLGIAGAVVVYLQHRVEAVEPDILLRAYDYDRVISRVIGRGGEDVAEATADVVDKAGIDGAVNGIAALVAAGGSRLRAVQTGYGRSYALSIAGGA